MPTMMTKDINQGIEDSEKDNIKTEQTTQKKNQIESL